jgi:hypothetical protein
MSSVKQRTAERAAPFRSQCPQHSSLVSPLPCAVRSSSHRGTASARAPGSILGAPQRVGAAHLLDRLAGSLPPVERKQRWRWRVQFPVDIDFTALDDAFRCPLGATHRRIRVPDSHPVSALVESIAWRRQARLVLGCSVFLLAWVGCSYCYPGFPESAKHFAP